MCYRHDEPHIYKEGEQASTTTSLHSDAENHSRVADSSHMRTSRNYPLFSPFSPFLPLTIHHLQRPQKASIGDWQTNWTQAGGIEGCRGRVGLREGCGEVEDPATEFRMAWGGWR